MRSAGISKLKASLSEYIDAVKAGEEVLVTDRGRAVARILPVAAGPSALPDRLKKLEGAGLIRVGTGKVPKTFWATPHPPEPGGKALGAILAERAEGR